MNIEELRKAAETLAAASPLTLTVAVAPRIAAAVEVAVNALPALLTVRDAASATRKSETEAEAHKDTCPDCELDCEPCDEGQRLEDMYLCKRGMLDFALRHLNEKGTDDADKRAN